MSFVFPVFFTFRIYFLPCLFTCFPVFSFFQEKRKKNENTTEKTMKKTKQPMEQHRNIGETSRKIRKIDDFCNFSKFCPMFICFFSTLFSFPFQFFCFSMIVPFAI